MSDPVKAPAHYAGNGEIECKDALSSMFYGADSNLLGPLAFDWYGCAFKYVWRFSRKNGVQDIDKAIECLTELRKLVE